MYATPSQLMSLAASHEQLPVWSEPARARRRLLTSRDVPQTYTWVRRGR